MVSLRDYSEQNLAPGSAGTKGLLFFAHAISCHGNLCLSQDPPEWIQLPCQQISVYKRAAAALGRHLASPKTLELSGADAHLCSLSHMGKAGSSPILLQSPWPGSQKGREQALLLLSWVLLEPVLLQNKLALCVPVVPGP